MLDIGSRMLDKKRYPLPCCLGNLGVDLLFQAMITNEPFLGYGGDQFSFPGVNSPVAQAPGLAGVVTLHGIQQPIIHAKFAMKPGSMIQAGDLHFLLPGAVAVGI